MINSICLLIEFIQNGVVLCKVSKIQKTKATSLFLKNMCEKMWRGVLVYYNLDGL